MTIKTKPFDSAKHFPDDISRAGLITDALASGHEGYKQAAIANAVKASGKTIVRRRFGPLEYVRVGLIRVWHIGRLSVVKIGWSWRVVVGDASQ